MFTYVKARYADKYTRVRAMAHAAFSADIMLVGLMKLGLLSLVLLALGPSIEVYQSSTDKAYDLKDGICDAAEWIFGASAAILVWRL